MCGRFDASADAGATTCHDEDIIQMFPAQQTACGKEKKNMDTDMQTSVK